MHAAQVDAIYLFMMAVTALSVPELVILRRVMKPRLIATFVGVVASGLALLIGLVVPFIFGT